MKKNKSEILDSGFHVYSFFSLSFFLDSALEVLHSTATAAAALQVSDYGKSGNPKRQKENLAIYSVTLTEEEMTKIDMLRDNPGYTRDVIPHIQLLQ